jgi:predicted TPR repeat methyltransferase
MEMLMTEREQISLKAQTYFDDLWSHGDPWELETSEFEHKRYTRLLETLDQPKYDRVLEIGCGSGTFTRLLAPRAQRLLALDVSTKAIDRAQGVQDTPKQVEFRVANIMDYDLTLEGPWDLIIMSETLYYLGWLYSFFDICWLAAELFKSTSDSGELLLANLQGEAHGPLFYPRFVRTYEHLFVNMGYQYKAQEIYRDKKDGIDLEIAISLFTKTSKAT